MDRRTLLAMVLCFFIFLGWQKLYIEPRMPRPQQTQVTTQAPQAPTTPGQSSLSQAPAPPTQQTRRTPETRNWSTPTGTAVLGDGSAAVVDWKLTGFRQGVSEQSPHVDLAAVTNKNNAIELAFDDPAYAYLSGIQGTFQNTPSGPIWTYEDANLKLTRQFQTVGQEPYVNLTFTAEFKNRKPNYAFVSLAGQSHDKDPEAQDRQLLYWTEKSLERVQLKDTLDQKDIVTPVKYVGVTNRYFLMTMVAQGPMEPKGQIQSLGPSAGRVSMVYPLSGNSITIPMRVYFGPKELDLLRKVDPALDNAVDLGWFQVFAYPLLKLLKFFYQYVKNYGIAIILLTILLKIVTYPLTYKSMKSMKDMARIQPQLQKIREKYKDDKEALNREMLTVMKTHGYNPMAGCLPMLVQMPIFFALYRVLYSSIELLHAPFALWIKDLSAHDPFYVTPVLLSITMYLQQKLSPQTATDPMQQKMMQFMPLMFGAFMLNLPSGLTLYMLTNAIASIIQQVILNKKLDIKPAPTVVASAR